MVLSCRFRKCLIFARRASDAARSPPGQSKNKRRHQCELMRLPRISPSVCFTAIIPVCLICALWSGRGAVGVIDRARDKVAFFPSECALEKDVAPLFARERI